MPQNFPACDREQELLLPPSLLEWLPESHLWFVIDAVAALDLEPFHASHRRDGSGRAAHDPAMMLALATGPRPPRPEKGRRRARRPLVPNASRPRTRRCRRALCAKPQRQARVLRPDATAERAAADAVSDETGRLRGRQDSLPRRSDRPARSLRRART